MTQVLSDLRTVGPVTRTDIVRYAGASGDFNPMHHDDPHAQKHGFPSVFAMGLYGAGVLAAEVAARVQPKALSSLTFRFVSPIWPDDLLSLVVELQDADHADIAITVDGQPRITGKCTFGTVEGQVPSNAVTPTDERLRKILTTELQPVSFPVEQGKVVEFARAVHAPPLFVDPRLAKRAGYPALPATPTFTVTSSFWDVGDATSIPTALGLDLPRVVHGEQRYTYRRSVLVGDQLVGTRSVTAAEVKPARGGGVMTLVNVRTDFVDSDGNLVLSEDMLMIERPAQS